jgi:hypothetical protein
MRHTYDAAAILKDAGLVAATGNATVGGSPKILDIGDGNMVGLVVLDVSAIEIASGDEKYTILVQGSQSPTFADTVVNLASMQFGALAVLDGSPSAAPVVGRYEMGFSNVIGYDIYRYLRIRVLVAGTIATGINFSAFLAPQPFGGQVV